MGKGKGHKLINLVGRTFGRLTVLSRVENNRFGRPCWLCECKCGTLKVIEGQPLRDGRIKSCKCFNREQNAKKNIERKKVMFSSKPEYLLWAAAKYRAKRDGLPFNIDYYDILIPEFCPVLGIPLMKATGKPADNSPTVDRIKPELGYVKRNILVISFKANSIKRDASAKEIRKVLEYVLAHQ